MSKQPIEILPLPVKELGKLSAVLNRAAVDGYSILDSCFVPAKGGGIIIYVLGFVGEGAIEAPEDTEAAENNDVAEAAEMAHTEGNGASLPDPEIVEQEA